MKGKEEYYNSNCQLIRTEKKEELQDSLSIMRKEMIQRKEVKALVCLGGKVKPNKNEEGVREEVRLAIEYNIPVFIVGSVGGCSANVAMEYKNNNWKDLNNAPKELNEQFLDSINYFEMAQDMLNFIDQIRKRKSKAMLIAKGIKQENIKKYGFAFEGKKVLIGE